MLNYAVVMRDGSHIKVTELAAKDIRNVLANITGSKFLEIGDVSVNSADISKVDTLDNVIELENKKQHKWKCDYGKWHKDRQECDCGMAKQPKGMGIASTPPQEMSDKITAFYKNLNDFDKRAVDFGAEKIAYNSVSQKLYLTVIADKDGLPRKLYEFEKQEQVDNAREYAQSQNTKSLLAEVQKIFA